ncbi:MAG: YicC family protein [Candidatus Omnitrophica bacterium]|nr:YicC family protein [Candidatus Omnitrophota bacterium]
MIKGMTGYGTAEISVGQVKVTIEVKSLNHRFFDLNHFLPIGFGSIENKIQQLVKKNVQRGRVTVAVKILERPLQAISLNKEAVKVYIKQAKVLKSEFGLKSDLTVADLIKLPGVVETKEVLVSPSKIWPEIKKGIEKALKSLVDMRKREGLSLNRDVQDKLKEMKLQIRAINKQSKLLLKSNRQKLSEDEFKSFQKSSDINEEISRLSHYIDELKSLLKATAPVGKKIDFIAQEMQRETNTIGSKVQDKIVSNAVINLKSKIEKIREQAQNIE